jgi:NAD-dependent dihydropyrimidine dehydrogenase PreA subunit
MRISGPAARHNETRYIFLDKRKCRACWECVESCPNGVIGKINLPFHQHARIDHPERCQGCRICVQACPEQAIIACQTERCEVGTL